MDDTLDKIEALGQWLAKTYQGLAQADGEGFMKFDGMWKVILREF